jgi:hypothetical protein
MAAMPHFSNVERPNQIPAPILEAIYEAAKALALERGHHIFVPPAPGRLRPQRIDATIVIAMCARFTVLKDTRVSSAISGCVFPSSRSNIICIRCRTTGSFSR